MLLITLKINDNVTKLSYPSVMVGHSKIESFVLIVQNLLVRSGAIQPLEKANFNILTLVKDTRLITLRIGANVIKLSYSSVMVGHIKIDNF
jgi:hypothetical protein